MSTIVKPSPISGFPEWLPYQKKHESEYIRQISLIFESFGFVPLETSAIERNEVLSSKGEINLSGINSPTLVANVSISINRYPAACGGEFH